MMVVDRQSAEWKTRIVRSFEDDGEKTIKENREGGLVK